MLINIELLGVNRYTDDLELYNNLTSSNNVLPWLQDTSQVNAWSLWGVTYRDVIILDSSNRVAGVMNLTDNDLTHATNRTRLKEMLRAVVEAGDSDRDRLPDHWEYRSFTHLNARADEDTDGDGFNNLVELAFATRPTDPLDVPRLNLAHNGQSGANQFVVTFDRWAGSAVEYVIDISTNLFDWVGSGLNARNVSSNYFDGTGRSRTTSILTGSSAVQSAGFVRINAKPKP